MLNLLQQLSKNISKLNVQLCRDLRTIRERAVSVTSIENPRARVVKCWNFQGVCLLKRYALWVRIQLYEIHELLATHYLELEDKDPERTAKRAAKRRSVAAHQAVTGKFPPKRRSQQGDEISALAQEFNHGPGEVEDNESNKEWLKVKVKKLEELMYLAATRSRCMGLTAVDLPGVDQPAIVYSPQLSNDEKMELDKYLKQFFRSARIRRE